MWLTAVRPQIDQGAILCNIHSAFLDSDGCLTVFTEGEKVQKKSWLFSRHQHLFIFDKYLMNIPLA